MMNPNHLKILVKSVIKETLNLLQEAQNGEWWIYPGGDAQFADGNVGDSNHEGYVIDYVTREIYEHFVGSSIDDQMGFLESWEDDLFRSLMSDNRLSEEEINEWKTGYGPAPILVTKLLEDKVYKDPEQANFAVFGAYGSQSKDMRDYAMKYLGWKRMTTHAGSTYLQTWFLTDSDLDTMKRGVGSAWGDLWDDSDEDESAAEHDIYIEIMSNGKEFNDIPLKVFENASVKDIIGYKRDLPWMKEQQMNTQGWINEGIFHENKEWIMYEGDDKITTLFQDNTRLTFEVRYPGVWGPDREKWRHKAASKWKSIAREIYTSQGLTEAGNPIVKPWKECYQEALSHPNMKEFIKKHHAPIFDPVNLTPR